MHRLFPPPRCFCRLDGMRWTLIAEFASDVGDARRAMRSRPSVSELSSTSAIHRVARLVLDATHLFWELRGLLDGASHRRRAEQ